jgi:hypothetical protein
MSVGYLLQGLRSNTLVAGKTTALRIVAAPWPASGVNGIQLSINRPDGSMISLSYAPAQWVIENAGTVSESLTMLIPGKKLPDVGAYYFRAILITAIGSVGATCVLDGVQFLPTKDLRMMVSRIWSGTGPQAKTGEVEAAQDAMMRLSFLYPVRDGISTLDGDMKAGLRYNFDNNPQGPPAQDGNLGPSWDVFKNPAAGKDSVDAAIAYRYPDASEGAGASTQPIYNGWLPWSLIVWQGPLHQVFSHETGHNHGLEPKTSPHFDPTGQAAHSKELTIDGSDTTNSFDIELNHSFPSTTYDIMFPSGPSPGYNADQVSLNSWDWEFVRQQLMKRTSTGPHEPFINWQALGGHDLNGYPTAIRNRDGRLEIFVIGGDNAVYHIWETSPGGAWHPWSSLGGHDLGGSIIATSAIDGRLQIFVRGGDGKIYSRAQSAPNGNWNAWITIGGTNVKGFAVARNADGRLEIVAIFDDGQLYDCWQASPLGNWSGWASLGGHDLKGPVALAANADGRLEAFVIGSDGFVYHRWQTSPNGLNGWAGWANLIDPRLIKAEDLRVSLSGDGRLFVILMTAQKSIGYLAQVVPNGDWGSVIDLYGHNLQWPCGLGRSDNGRLEVAVIGGDNKLYSRWNVDPSRSDLFVNWTSLGGKGIRPGVSLVSNHDGQLELYVIGGDGALYRGLRPIN